MSDRPDFTANTALNAVADTLDNLPVSINAQTLGSLAVDIAAQSAGDIDINLNTASDTVTVALGSSTVTLDVNIAGSNTTVDTDITGSSTTLDTNISGSNTTLDTQITGSSTTLDTDISAQSVGDIDTIINGQVGDVDIRFSSQSGNVDINFNTQTSGVASATEFAAQQGNTLSRKLSRSLSGNTTDTGQLFTNGTGGPVILETLTMASFRDFTDNCRAAFTVDTGSVGVGNLAFSLTPTTAPLMFDPGVLMGANGDITLIYENNSANATDIEATAVLREL
jgi:hypothetical protein